jgi:iron(III) transport system substrate-binding protein
MIRAVTVAGICSTICSAVVAAVALVAFPASARAQTWDEVVQAANREGELHVHGGPGRAYTDILTTGFKKAYPGIKLIYSGSPGREAIPQITRERQAGIYNWDVYVGGTPSILQSLKPAGAFAPLRPALMLPEVTDDKAWRNGFEAGWSDAEKTLTYAFDFTMDPVVYVNWDFVSRDDLRTFKDLLKAQFADKIVWTDPRVPGEGVFVAQVMMVNFGLDYVTDILSKQKIVYTNNRRQNAEWVVRGRYPIGFATSPEDLALFREQGLGKNVGVFNGDITKLVGGAGFGTVSLMDRAPHPNAAKVYINWLLSKAGQAEWKQSQRNSRRLDVPLGAPDIVTPNGVPYQDVQAEPFIPMRDQLTNLAKKYIQ